MPNYFVIRQDTSPGIREVLYDELRRGRLRQGWGIRNLGLRQGEAEWINRMIEEARRVGWQEFTDPQTPREAMEIMARNRRAILLPMTQIESGDRILVPKQPQYGRFVIVTAVQDSEGRVYWFDNEPEPGARGVMGDDYRHVVNVNGEQVKEAAYEEDFNTLVINRKMRAYQSAVNKAWDEEFRRAVDLLLERELEPERPRADSVRDETFQRVVPSVLAVLRQVSARELERVVERLFAKQGFDVVRGHVYDREGGDIDLMLRYTEDPPGLIQALSSDAQLGLLLHVQVKQKSGVDSQDMLGVKQLVSMSTSMSRDMSTSMSRDSGSRMPIISVLISTADSFTGECRKLAEDKGVLLIDGPSLAQIFLKYS